MSVTLNSTGITYSDGTSDYTNIIPTGTRVPFHMASAPTGWTQDTTDVTNNRMLRFVNDINSGGGSGGAYDPTYNNVLPSHGHTFTTGGQSQDHTHGDTGSHAHTYVTCSMSTYRHAHSGDGAIYAPGQAATSSGPTNGYHFTGITANHTHSGTTAAPGGTSNWTPKYTDLIVCSKN